MEIKPIRSNADYQAALQEIEKLMGAPAGTPESDQVEVLVTLVEAYEAKHFPIPEPEDPVEVLEYYLESRGLSRSDLVPYLGSKERVSEVLHRKRGLSLQMIQRLHAGLGIPAELLIGKSAHHSPSESHPQHKAQISI
jgi:HTH-type transcriptional regulator/antitoxin HigA